MKNIKNWKLLIHGIKHRHSKQVKLHRMTILGRWRALSHQLLDYNKEQHQYRRPKTTRGTKNWTKLVKKFSIRSCGKFKVLLFEPVDIGLRIIALKLNLKKIKK